MRFRVVLPLSAVWLAAPRAALAGMPSLFPALSEVGRLRFSTISFFLLLLLLCTLGLRAIWNALTRDFPRLPRLTFAKALGVVALWGLLFLIVLTMISGARELLTPGAWKPDGLTFRLADTPSSRPTEEPVEITRRRKLESLRMALWLYAQAHDGHFPMNDKVPDIPAEVWQTSDPSGMRFLYVGGDRKVDQGAWPVAYEPGLFGRDRLVLFSDGTIQTMSLAAIRHALTPENP